ncbi:hypothetical protein BHE90_017410, partial [Fusarium euwallaceae]
SQSITVDKMVTDLSERDFQTGLSYVAVSRVIEYSSFFHTFPPPWSPHTCDLQRSHTSALDTYALAKAACSLPEPVEPQLPPAYLR